MFLRGILTAMLLDNACLPLHLDILGSLLPGVDSLI